MLQSLPESFTQFRQNYNMNKYSYFKAKLLKELPSAEGLIKPVTRAYVAEKSSAPKSKGKKKSKKV